TDASINPGNSGGLLLDSAGNLVGVNTAIIGPGGGSAGIGFAVPVNTVRKVVPAILRHGRVIRPVLGIGVVDDRIAAGRGIKGAIILNVDPRAGAARAGLKGLRRTRSGRTEIGDVIVAVDKYPVTDSDDLLYALEQFKTGDTVTVKTVRGGKERSFQVRLSAP
ncbi:MAG: PDZ domain-containing protein, partial [bacterium]